MFDAYYWKKTLVLALAWISACVCYYNLNFIMPLLLTGFTKNVKYALLAVFYGIEIVSTLMTVGFIDWAGRLNSTVVFSAIACLCYLALQVLRSPTLNFWMFAGTSIVLKFVSIALFIALYPYTS